MLEEYGRERFAYVLACTVQHKESDGRFSRGTKEWAASIPVAENIRRGMDLNNDYVIDSYPAVLDGFIGLARDKFVELEKMEQQKKAEPFIVRYYVVNNAYGIKAEREYQYFPDLDSALTAYMLLPNHLEKEIGMESTEQPSSRMSLIKCRKTGVSGSVPMKRCRRIKPRCVMRTTSRNISDGCCRETRREASWNGSTGRRPGGFRGILSASAMYWY